MRKTIILSCATLTALTLAGCGGKLGELTADNFKVTPTPLEAHAGEVSATINGTFPKKYMKKKAVVTVTPVLKYDAGETTSEGATFQGEKVLGNNTTISYKLGGNYTMKANFPYKDEMLKSDLYARFDAKVGKKTVTVPEVKIGYGILATSDLLGNCLKSATGSTASDNFQRVIAQKQEATIKFLIGKANLRASELENPSMKDLAKVLHEINDSTQQHALNEVSVSAYASPDGGYKVNEKLAQDRQKTSADYLRKQLDSLGLVKTQIASKYTAEDWEGFQQLIGSSNYQDKDVILRVLSMYDDPEEREQKIKEMGAIYPEIADGIMPELRRSRILINYEVVGRNDNEILATYASHPEELSLEEHIYGASMLAETDAEKEAWYKKIIDLHSYDYRAYNNLAQLYIKEGRTDEAEKLLKQAAALEGNGAETGVNQSLLALQQGDIEKAETVLAGSNKAEGYNEMVGNINLATGNYAQAAKAFEGVNTNSAALAQILSDDYLSARNTLNSVSNPDATTSYLKAILAARTDDSATLVNSLRDAISKDSSYATRAANDLEFSKYTNTVQALLQK